MNFDEEYQKLNPAQAAAVDQIDGTVMVIAGPGTGKTQLLAMRVANILKKTDTGPGSILCLTFTESAATNMTERMAQIFGADAYRVAVHTFHSFGSEIIGRYPEYFYDGAVFQPAGELTTLEILDEILSDLAHDNPLTATMNGGWTYLSELARTISDFKKAGLAPSEVSQLLTQNLAFTAGITPLLRKIFSDKITLATVEAAGELLQTAEKAMAETPRLPFSTEPTLAEIFTHSLARHLGEAKTTNKTKPLTEWKKLWTTKNPHGELILKDDKLSQKLLFASEVYAKYTDAMTARGFYDFDDMILRVIAAIEKNPDLRAELQETFQYVLVDEFQDTNDAQMRLLRTLTDYDDNPNLLVVGDDDQAIYRFQGADISNIRQFATRFPTLTVISLSENYRSGAAILDLAGNVVSQISERLTSADGSAKQLVKKVNFASKVRRISTATREAEYDFIAQEIRQLLDTGVDPSEIAVISRNHKQLERLLPFLAAQNIAIDYERRRDVLGSEPIQQLINLGLVAEAIARGVPAVIDEYLPQVLAHPAWQIAAFDLWQISLNAHEKRLNWLDALSAEPKFAPLVAWLQTVAQLSQNEPLENILDELIGFASPASPAWCETFSSSDPSVSETSYTGAPAEPSLRTNLSGTSGIDVSDSEGEKSSAENIPHQAVSKSLAKIVSNPASLTSASLPGPGLKSQATGQFLQESLASAGDCSSRAGSALTSAAATTEPRNDGREGVVREGISPGKRAFSSPLYDYFFAAGKLQTEPEKYLSFLADLTTLRQKLREWRPDQMLKLADFLDFVREAQTLDQPIVSNLALATENRVKLLTAHKAKGLEFDHVLIIDANSEIWGSKTRVRGSILGLPHNMPRLAGDSDDERLRLFFVALTRARRNLVITSSETDGDKTLLPLEYVLNLKTENLPAPDIAIATRQLATAWHAPLVKIDEDLHALLADKLANYQLSATHLNTFLAVDRGGPGEFLLRCLLRFPIARTPQALFGTAIHTTLQRTHTHLTATGSLKPLEDVLGDFVSAMNNADFSPRDRDFYTKKGVDVLTIFLPERAKTFTADQKVEQHFAAVVDDMRLTGLIDLIDLDKKNRTLILTDYKTGKAPLDWRGVGENEKIKLRRYRRQLMFYKLLIENSREFAGWTAERGVLEFVEPIDGQLVKLELDFNRDEMKEFVELLKKVWSRIMALDLPPIDDFSANLAGLIDFEKFLVGQ